MSAPIAPANKKRAGSETFPPHAPTRPDNQKQIELSFYFFGFIFPKPALPAHEFARNSVFGAGGADGARISAFRAEKFGGQSWSKAGLASRIPHLGLCKPNHPHEPGGGPEQEVCLNKKKKVVNTSMYPDEVIERLARCFYPAILECFNSEEGQRAFAAWQEEQARLTAKEKQDVPAGERPVLHSNRQRLFSDEAHSSGCAFLFGSRVVSLVHPSA